MTIGTNSPHVSLWVTLVHAHQRVNDAIEAAFKVEDLPCLEWYDVLQELDSETSPMRACEIESELLVPQCNLSRLLDRLEREALIIRTPDPDDGRSRLIELTDQGRALRQRMWPVYELAVHESICIKVDGEEAANITATLQKLL